MDSIRASCSVTLSSSPGSAGFIFVVIATDRGDNQPHTGGVTEGKPMYRVVIGVCLLGLIGLLAYVQSAAPPAPVPSRARVIRALPLVDRMYAEIDFPGYDDPKTTLEEVIRELAREYGLLIEVDEKAFKVELLNDI